MTDDDKRGITLSLFWLGILLFCLTFWAAVILLIVAVCG